MADANTLPHSLLDIESLRNVTMKKKNSVDKASIKKKLYSAVHNEITFRSLEDFIPKSKIQQSYKDDMLDSASYTQAGSFFPDWGYQCLGNNQQSEDAHWPTFIKTAVNYVREVYPIDQFHTDSHVKGLISFIFAIMSHGMADVKWHSLSGLQDYFIVAMAKSDFHGNQQEAHLAADAGAEFTLRHSNKLSYLNETWQVPVKDIIEIYTRLYASDAYVTLNRKVPLESHIQYCMTAAFAASKIDVEFGQLMFGYYGSKSPFLIEQLYDYYKGGVEDMSGSVTDCFPQLIDAFEHGASYGHPDILCADYFYTIMAPNHTSSICLTGSAHPIQSQYQSKSLPDSIYQDYNAATGLLTITVNKDQQSSSKDHESLLPIVGTTASPQTSTKNEQTRLQVLLGQHHSPQEKITQAKLIKKCISLENQDISGITLSIPMSSARVGHQVVSGDFNGNGQLDVAISAPYYHHLKTGAVFILNGANSMIPSESAHIQYDIRNQSQLVLEGDLPHGRFGWSMTVLDMNQDSIDDLAVSTPFQGNGRVDVYFGQANIGLLRQPSIRIHHQFQELLGTVLAGIDVNHDGYKDLVIGCPLCSVGNQPQVGAVYVFKSQQSARATDQDQPKVFTQPDISFENPNMRPYDQFGHSILIVKNTILIGAPGYSVQDKQRVGRVYAFDVYTKQLKWTISGSREFQQYGSVLATDANHDMIAISSPSEGTRVGLQRFWQAGTVRIYDWNQLENDEFLDSVSNFNMEDGMMSIIKGRTNAGHLGQSLSIFGDKREGGIWIGEPMSERENGRVYQWKFNGNTKDIECIRNNRAILARFGSQIGPLGRDAICITSQRYGQNARYDGAVTLLEMNKT